MSRDLPKLTVAEARAAIREGATYDPADRTHDRVILKKQGRPIGWLPRKTGESGNAAYYDFEIELKDELDPNFPPGMEHVPDPNRRPPPLARVHPHVTDMRAKCIALLGLYSPWLDPDFSAPAKDTFGIYFDEPKLGGDPIFKFNPLVRSDRLDLGPRVRDKFERFPLIRGWSRPEPLYTKAGKKKVPDRHFGFRAANDTRLDDDDVLVDRSGNWKLAASGKRKLEAAGTDETTLRCVVPTEERGVRFHVGTSKMGCASWNLPAGPKGGGVNGACAAAAPILLNERREGLSDAERQAYADKRQAASAGIWGMIESLEEKISEIPGGGWSTGVSRDRDRNADANTKATDVKLICSLCYALKGNYTNLNQQFYMLARWVWAQAALQWDVRGNMPGGEQFDHKVSAEEAGRRSFFAYAMTEAIKRYYAEDRLEARLTYAEDPRFYRIHDSGDFFSHRYTWAWIQIAENLPQIKFWAPTRMWMFPGYMEIFQQAPKNFVIRPSAMQVEDDAPSLPGLAGGSTAAPGELGTHWECPATRNDRGSCIGGLTMVRKLGMNVEHQHLLPPSEHSCRVCWGSFPRAPQNLQEKVRLLPVTYHEH